eukprot:scaffold582_cov73-Cylindrotheca_fusiformis.AAC.5
MNNTTEKSIRECSINIRQVPSYILKSIEMSGLPISFMLCGEQWHSYLHCSWIIGRFGRRPKLAVEEAMVSTWRFRASYPGTSGKNKGT